MKRRLAHALKRAARTLIGWANRIDGPVEIAPFHLDPKVIRSHTGSHEAIRRAGGSSGTFIAIAPPGGLVGLEPSLAEHLRRML